jgi:hypothetical protein
VKNGAGEDDIFDHLPSCNGLISPLRVQSCFASHILRDELK